MKYKAVDLWDDMLTEHKIFCSKCRNEDNIMNCDEDDACEYFFKQGWRRTPLHIYCPNCSKKNLKNQ